MTRPTLTFDDLEWITCDEAGTLLRQSARTVRERAQAGEFGEQALIREGGRYLIHQPSIRAHLRRLRRAA